MIVLGIDTAHAACSVCLYDAVSDSVLAKRCEPMHSGHAERLSDLTGEVFVDAALKIYDVDRLASCIGPGTFTGVRIALAFLRGLALVTKAPTIGISTFEVLAVTCRKNQPDHNTWIVQDARRGEVYMQGFDANGQPLSEAAVLTIADANALLIDKTGLAAGSGASLLDLPEGIKPVDIDPIPDIEELVKLAVVTPDQQTKPEPLYLRAPDAKAQAPLVKHHKVPIRIKQASTLHHAVLAQIHAKCFEEAWDDEAFASLLATPGALALMAIEDSADNSEPCGFVIIRKADAEMEILTLAVLPAKRRRAVGSQLLEAVYEQARQSGAAEVFIEYAMDNEAARALYKKHGYVQTGIRKNYYKQSDGTYRDAVTARLAVTEKLPTSCHSSA